jgi:hypothetical protein
MMPSSQYRIEFSQNPNNQEDPTYTIHNEELKIGTGALLRSDEVCKLPRLSNLHPEGEHLRGDPAGR